MVWHKFLHHYVREQGSVPLYWFIKTTFESSSAPLHVLPVVRHQRSMSKLRPSLRRRTSPSASNVDAWMRRTPRMDFHHWRKMRRVERRQRGREERSFLGDGGGHGGPQGSSGCDGQLLDLCVQTSDDPLHRLTTLRTDIHSQTERVMFLTKERPISV